MTVTAPAAVTLPDPAPQRGARRRGVNRDASTAWGLLSPNLLLFGVFLLLPLAATVVLSSSSSSASSSRAWRAAVCAEPRRVSPAVS